MIDHAHNPQPLAGPHLSPGGDRRLRVLIADPDGLARCMMRTALAEQDRVAIVFTAATGREALELARYYHPSVMVIDTALSPCGAVQLIHQVRQIAPQTPILTISVADPQTALAALRAGAVGHLDKDLDPDHLAEQVIKAADGEAVVPQPLIMPLLELIREIPDRGWRPLHSRLTTREWELIELLDQDATTDQIAQQLVLTHATVYSHIKSILRKLKVRSRTDAVTAAQHLRRQETLGDKPPHPDQPKLDNHTPLSRRA